MNEKQRAPKVDEKLAKEITKKIVRSGKLGETSTLEEVAVVLGDYVEDEITGFRADIFDPDTGEKCITIRTKLKKKNDPDDVSDFLDMFLDDPLTEEEQDITATIRLTYSLLLKEYNILNPLAYKIILEKIGLNQLKKIPKYSEVDFDKWASKIIEQFVISNDIPIERVTYSVIQFFQMLFPDYSFKYYHWKDQNRYPLLIDRKGEDSLMWAVEISEIRTILFNTHYVLLNKLQRQKNYPIDPDFWFDLVVLYEELNQKDKAYQLGTHGLKLNPKEISALSNIITYYIDKRRFKDSVRFLKTTARIYEKKNMLTVAERTWKTIIQIEPMVKENWQELADVLTTLGKTTEAEQCLQRIKRMK